jgi:hypothetical protein
VLALMSGGPPGRTVGAMTRIHPIRTAAAIAAAVLFALVLWPSAGHAAGKTKTLRFFVEDVSFQLTQADGTVVDRPPFREPTAGDVIDVTSLLFRGDHRQHAKRWSGSVHLRCVFGTGEPDCESQVALGGSLLIFRGNPGTLTIGTGRFQGATGRVIKNQDVPGGLDIVAKIRLR